MARRVDRPRVLVVAGTGLIAATYGLVRLAYGLFLPDITASLSLSASTAAATASGSSVAYCVGALLGLGARRGARLLVVGAVVTAAVGSVGMALSTGAATFVPCAVLSSMGAGLASPGLVAVVGRGVATRDAPRAQAVVNAGTGPGLVAAGLLALVLLPDWRLGFVVSAVLTAVAGAVVLLADRGPSDDDAVDDPPAPLVARAGLLLLRPAGAALLLGGGSAATWTYGRTVLVEGGLGATASTLAWIVLGLGATGAVLTAGRLADAGPSMAWRLTASAVAVATAVLAGAPDRAVPAVAAFAVFGWGFVAASSALIAWATEARPASAAATTSVLFVVLVLGQALGAAGVSAVAGGLGFPVAFGLAAAVAGLAAAHGTGRASPRRSSLTLGGLSQQPGEAHARRTGAHSPHRTPIVGSADARPRVHERPIA